MPNKYDSQYTGLHNDGYEPRIKALEDQTLNSRLVTLENFATTANNRLSALETSNSNLITFSTTTNNRLTALENFATTANARISALEKIILPSYPRTSGNYNQYLEVWIDGTDFNDHSHNHYCTFSVGTLNRTTDGGRTVLHRAASGASNTNCLEIRDQVPIDKFNSYSISCWIKPLGTTNWQSFWSINNNNTSNNLFELRQYGNTAYFGQASRDNLSTTCDFNCNNTMPLNTNSWSFIVVVFDGLNISYYQNGELKATQTITNKMITQPRYIIICGGIFSVDTSNTCLMKDWRLYSCALPAEEISRMYNVGAEQDG